MILFIVVALAIIVGGHLGLYFSWLHFFQINQPILKRVILAILGVLSVSFVATTVLLHFYENRLTSWLYLMASGWLGIAWYLALAMGLTWLGIALGGLTDMDLNVPLIASIFIALSLFYSVYGFLNADKIYVSEISVEIKNLPQAWNGRVAVLLSDIHLGAILHEAFTARVARAVNYINPDIVFIAGDLFDGVGKKLNNLAAPLDLIEAPQGIYYVTGNHETLVGLKMSLEAVKKTKIVILDDRAVEVDGLQILGISYPQPGEKRDIDSVLNKLDLARPSIILYHEPKLSIIEKASKLGASLFLAGHTHVGQIWPFNYITKIAYHDLDYGLHQVGHTAVYTSSGVGTWGPAMRSGNKPEIVKIILKQKK